MDRNRRCEDNIKKYFVRVEKIQTTLRLCCAMLSHFSHVRLFMTPWAVAQPGSSVHGAFQARILEWVAMPSSSGTLKLSNGKHKLAYYASQFPGSDIQAHGIRSAAGCYSRLLRLPGSFKMASLILVP